MKDAFGVEVSKSFVPRSQLVAQDVHLFGRYRPSRVPRVTAIKATVLKEKQPELFGRRLRELRRNKKARDLKASGEQRPRRVMVNLPRNSVYAPDRHRLDAETYKRLLKYKPSQAVRPPRKKIYGQDRLF